jgi:hypothetical protein
MTDEEKYEVSHIVEEDYSNPNQRVFLVRWLGYSAEHDSWEPLENLEEDAIEVVREWDRKQRQKQKTRDKLQNKRGKSADRVTAESRPQGSGLAKSFHTVDARYDVFADVQANTNTRASPTNGQKINAKAKPQKSNPSHNVPAQNPLIKVQFVMNIAYQ